MVNWQSLRISLTRYVNLFLKLQSLEFQLCATSISLSFLRTTGIYLGEDLCILCVLKVFCVWFSVMWSVRDLLTFWASWIGDDKSNHQRLKRKLYIQEYKCWRESTILEGKQWGHKLEGKLYQYFNRLKGKLHFKS